jgi:hypothetical protein
MTFSSAGLSICENLIWSRPKDGSRHELWSERSVRAVRNRPESTADPEHAPMPPRAAQSAPRPLNARRMRRPRELTLLRLGRRRCDDRRRRGGERDQKPTEQ